MNARDEALTLEERLRVAGDPGRALKEKAYLKSDVDHFGTSVPAIRRAVKTWARAHRDLVHDDLIALVSVLWDRGVHECRMAAVELLDLHRDLLTTADLGLLEGWIRGSRTWALVDPLTVSIASGLADEATVKLWASDDDFWIRRASLLTFLRPLRTGGGDLHAFGRVADPMLEEKEFFIRKAIGWVLREASKRDPDGVYGWIAPRTDRASGVTIREVVRHLDPNRAAEVMLAYKERRKLG
jgi:3-methyladenine DNA glycosylase AlkD